MKKKYAIVGTGGRSGMFLESIVRKFADSSQLVALCDVSKVRMGVWNRVLEKEYDHEPVPAYHADAFDRMIEETQPDAVVVTTMDSIHHRYIVRAMELGCDAITEKPMTTDDAKCNAIMDTVEKTGKRVRVTFNYRWGTFNTKVKELLGQGLIGKVRSVNMEYLLNTSHGADYYRRWHSHMACSGGLLVHKATHHFDLVNWMIDGIPEQIFAYGDLVFYGKENAVARGDGQYTGYPRYTGFVTREEDPFAINLDSGPADAIRGPRELYYKAEAETGYLRDQNVFREGIDIYDSMSVVVRYRHGPILTYSLNAYSPREGMRLTFNGDRGRIEYYEFTGSHIIMGQTDAELDNEQRGDTDQRDERIVVYPHFKPSYTVIPEREKGGHGGADPKLQEQIFSANPPEETLGRNAGHEQGAASILIGIAANRSIATNQPVTITDLVPLKADACHLSELA